MQSMLASRLPLAGRAAPSQVPRERRRRPRWRGSVVAAAGGRWCPRGKEYEDPLHPDPQDLFYEAGEEVELLLGQEEAAEQGRAPEGGQSRAEQEPRSPEVHKQAEAGGRAAGSSQHREVPAAFSNAGAGGVSTGSEPEPARQQSPQDQQSPESEEEGEDPSDIVNVTLLYMGEEKNPYLQRFTSGTEATPSDREPGHEAGGPAEDKEQRQ